MIIHIKKIIVFLLLIFLLFSCRFDDEEANRKWNFKGIIVKNYQNDNNHGMLTFDIVDNNHKFWVLSEKWPRCWEFADIGDSVIKLPDTLILIIKKPNGTVKEFDYDW